MRNVDGEVDVLRERVERLESAKPAPRLIEDEMREVRAALARGYGHSKNTKKRLDHDLIEAMTGEVLALLAHRTAKLKED